MSKLTNHNGRYCESEFENAFIGFLENAGWQYAAGSKNEVPIAEDFKQFIAENKTRYRASTRQAVSSKSSATTSIPGQHQ